MNVRIAVSSRRALAVKAAITILAALVFAAGPAAAANAASATPGGLPSSGHSSGRTVHFQGIAPVGALFSAPVYTGSDAAHFCTGSVIASPHGDLVLTAAHCVWNASTHTYTHSSITFAPGYDNAPVAALGGVWTVSQIDVAPDYLANGNPADDYALLVVAPKSGRTIQQFTGALRLATTHLPVPVRVVGYNDLQYDPDGNKPIECRALAFEETDAGAPWARFNCPNYQDGTSGGPWIIAGTNRVIGVIGGYEQGGDSPDWSYSAIFNASTSAFYASVAF